MNHVFIKSMLLFIMYLVHSPNQLLKPFICWKSHVITYNSLSTNFTWNMWDSGLGRGAGIKPMSNAYKLVSVLNHGYLCTPETIALV